MMGSRLFALGLAVTGFWAASEAKATEHCMVNPSDLITRGCIQASKLGDDEKAIACVGQQVHPGACPTAGAIASCTRPVVTAISYEVSDLDEAKTFCEQEGGTYASLGD